VGGTQLERQGTASVAGDDLEVPEELSRRKLRRQLLSLTAIVLAVVAVVTLLPGLDGLRARLSHAKPGWLALGVGLKVLSGLGYVAIFRMVFCRRMSWRVSYQIGMSEVGANALLPTGGAGGLALGAWALKRGGMPASEIARRTAAFFLLTSVANVVGVVVIGLGLAVRVLPGRDEPRADAAARRDRGRLDPWLAARGTQRWLVARAPAGKRSERVLQALHAGAEDARGRRGRRQRGGRAAARGQRRG
jgi:predicted anti-sigma-YlaC factor YlaD